MFRVQIEKNKAWVTERETLTLYCQGCDPVKIELSFNDEWDGLSKIAVFRAYDRQIDSPGKWRNREAPEANTSMVSRRW